MKTRVNINLDSDAYDFAAAYASGKGIALGSAVSELFRQVQQIPRPQMSASPSLKTRPRGYLVKAKTGRVITPEMVKEAAEDDLA